jgi:hypothetical protein
MRYRRGKVPGGARTHHEDHGRVIEDRGGRAAGIGQSAAAGEGEDDHDFDSLRAWAAYLASEDEGVEAQLLVFLDGRGSACCDEEPEVVPLQ